ncbi:MAG: MBL fold metallo-hydrolase [Pseudomonadota bacterium]
MTPLKWILVSLVAAAAVGFAIFQVTKPLIVQRAFERAVTENVGVDRSLALPDGLHVYMCGTGSPMADADRAGPCIGVLAGDKAYMVDIGSGGARKLGRMGFPMERLERVFLTHLHSDHMDGLGELMLQAWVAGARTEPMPISGPSGVEEVVDGLNAAYRIDSGYRIAHHGPEVVPPSGYGGVGEPIILPIGPTPAQAVLEDGDLTITAFPVLHAPVEPAYGYRIDYKDRSVSISGDLIYSPSLVAASENVDVLFHEALQPEMTNIMREAALANGRPGLAKILEDILDYHATPGEAARAASEAGAGKLVYYHTIPPIPTPALNPMFLGDARDVFAGPITVAQDGLLVSLPAGSDEVAMSMAIR